jgi:hypothetical protein
VSLLPRVLPRPRVEQSPWEDGRLGVDQTTTARPSERVSKP